MKKFHHIEVYADAQVLTFVVHNKSTLLYVDMLKAVHKRMLRLLRLLSFCHIIFTSKLNLFKNILFKVNLI